MGLILITLALGSWIALGVSEFWPRGQTELELEALTALAVIRGGVCENH